MSNDLDKFTKDLLAMAHDLDRGKHAKRFLLKEGSKLRKETLKQAKLRVNKKTGNLFKGIKRGKVYKYMGEDLSVRVYGGKPAYHIHLLNYGHRIVDKNGKEHGFKKGHHFFEKAEKNFQNEYYQDTEEWLDDLLDKHGL